MPRHERIVVYRAEEGGFWGQVAGRPGCVAQADTLEELRDAAIDAVQAWEEAGGEPEPRPYLTMDIPLDRDRLPA